jgi:hypothetical protein
MDNYQLHLEQLKEQQKQLTEEIQKLSIEATEKRDLLLKVQGAIEYIQQIAVEQSQDSMESQILGEE